MMVKKQKNRIEINYLIQKSTIIDDKLSLPKASNYNRI